MTGGLIFGMTSVIFVSLGHLLSLGSIGMFYGFGCFLGGVGATLLLRRIIKGEI